MPLKIIRQDITKMNTEAIVNTANEHVAVGTGCDSAVYKAAGYDALLNYRKEHIGVVEEGEVFITPGFQLHAKYIIHAVSPEFADGNRGEEEKLRSCYKKSLQLAKENQIRSIAFPLISTGGFGYPKEEGMRIAVDEINAFLLGNDMEVFLVVFDPLATQLGKKVYPELEAYIDQNYVRKAYREEYDTPYVGTVFSASCSSIPYPSDAGRNERKRRRRAFGFHKKLQTESVTSVCEYDDEDELLEYQNEEAKELIECRDEEAAFEELNEKLNERLTHKADTFSEYLLYLIESKGMKNADVYNRAVVDKRYFSKIKNNKNFHPEKIKALCLCVGARLNLDETKDLLARAGYALSPADLTDIIFSFYIEQEHFDIIDIDIQLEEHGLPCIIS